ncbi:uncharacterized protein Tco025E_00936 [Trypanosoma conorhini]|uniref:Uncharacterized protein n=1 Tax=Trypanosoma conorhini TaxID=83891 RepID=A0A422QA70_9TRYP|nr:uncharacterized protein Tco025E_00936 [Trypanosoma conorhini]RNF26854.1 hypothetical protein Tco025E_00936 [Trypanosoma conorhini]
MASRYAVKYLKREDYGGVLLPLLCGPAFFVCWTVALNEYAACWREFQGSRARTRGWWSSAFFPSLASVASYYAGGARLASHTTFDTRVAEMLLISYVCVLLFRAASFFIGVRIVMNFGRGHENRLLRAPAAS